MQYAPLCPVYYFLDNSLKIHCAIPYTLNCDRMLYNEQQMTNDYLQLVGDFALLLMPVLGVLVWVIKRYQ